MRTTATPIALAALLLNLTIVPAAAADRDMRASPDSQIALQPATPTDVAEAMAPNCLLPGQIRNFSGLTLVTPQRAVTLPAVDCAARGGQAIASTAAAD
jgi:hypothetical protein